LARGGCRLNVLTYRHFEQGTSRKWGCEGGKRGKSSSVPPKQSTGEEKGRRGVKKKTTPGGGKIVQKRCSAFNLMVTDEWKRKSLNIEKDLNVTGLQKRLGKGGVNKLILGTRVSVRGVF